MGPDKIKINWAGSQCVNHSLALVNREICKRLIAEDKFDIKIIPYEEDPHFVIDKEIKSIKEKYAVPDSQADITVRHQWPPDFNRPNSNQWILMQPWEFGSIPRKWYIPMKYWIDEVWVYSAYNKECYVQSGIPENKIKVIPLGVDENTFHYNVEPIVLNTNKSFKFLFVGGTLLRKGIDMLLQAYVDEFTQKDDVCLVIKDVGTSSFYQGRNLGEIIRRLQADEKNPEILYINQELSSKEMAGLYKACNCLASPYRGEGFGLPIIEAMACGTPAIVPCLGPSKDFCHEDTAFLIPSKQEKWMDKKIDGMETVDFPWWLKIDKNELQRKMRFTYENQETVKQKGQKASQEIVSTFTWSRSVQLVSERLQELGAAKQPTRLSVQEIITEEVKKGIELYQKNELDQALDTFLRVLDTYPASIDARSYVAGIFFQRKEMERALEQFSIMSNMMEKQLEAFQASIWNYIGICHASLEEYEKAIHAFRKGLKGNPVNRLMVINCYQDMIRQLDKKELLTESYYNLGMQYFEMGNDFRAKEMYEKALEMDANRQDVQQSLQKVREKILRAKETYTSRRSVAKVKNIEELYHRVAYTFEGEEGGTHQPQEYWLSYFLPGDRVLDIGCGNKRLMEMLNHIGVETDGHGSVNGLSMKGQKVEDFPVGKEAMYDGIFLGGVVEYLAPDDLLNLLVQCITSLKNNGKLIIVAPNIIHPSVFKNFWLGLTHGRPYPKQLMESILETLGLMIKESTYQNDNAYDYYVVAQKNAYEIVWQSPIYNASGYAEEQKSFLDALKPFPLKVKIEPTEPQPKPELTKSEMKNYLESLQHNKLEQPLIHYQAAPAYLFTYPHAPISIGRTMFETDSLPPGWVEKMNELTEIWVPSEFNRETFATAGVEKERIFILPGTLDAKLYNPDQIQPYPLANTYSFKFLSVFDWNKRKGWDVLVRAYFKEFSAKEDVCLILKISKMLESNANIGRDILEQARLMGLRSIPPIQIVESYFTEEDMIRLYAAVDAFVLPSRGEGWGRPYMEAMAMALPTIGTRWGGQTAFMNDTNSYLIDVEGIVPIERSIPYFGRLDGHRWAEPSEEHLRLLMRSVYENAEQAKQIGKKAREEVFNKFSKQKVAERMYRRIDELVQRFYG
ncbi:glycosyltransferase [Aneurinibacillus aneurinilyticus]|uniref:glycosyltransferase n=1 Tax=Aneurinibacillus aneurinilyticus TaxID=1391 RepID=UPI0023F6ABDC|nr:glycosyltransferase [Aneurinibacillus aneurinilyticus]MCI1693597.1 glycosyltransferase [Aneurinibacillus aneurinilyticus]